MLGIPMPPSALLAMVGPRVANHVLHTLHDAFPDRFPLSPTLENFANGEMDIVLTGDARADGRRDPRGDPRGARRRVPSHPRRGRRRVGGRDRRLPHPRRRLPVLPRRADEVPRRERASRSASRAARWLRAPPVRHSPTPHASAHIASISGTVPRTAPLDAPKRVERADPQGKQHRSPCAAHMHTRPTSTRHHRRSRQRAWKPPRSAHTPGTASRSSTPVRIPPPRSLPAPRAAARSTTRSPRWRPAAAPRRTAGASATGSCSASSACSRRRPRRPPPAPSCGAIRSMRSPGC